MRITLLLENSNIKSSTSKGEGFNFKIHLGDKDNKNLDYWSGKIFEKDLEPKKIANLLYVKYGELLQQGITVAIANNNCKANQNLKDGLSLLKKAFPNTSYVMTNHYDFKVVAEEEKLNLHNILKKSESIKSKDEAVYIEEIKLKRAKKTGYAITHYKNGHIVSSSSELFNRGITVSSKARIEKLDKMLKDVSSNAQIYLCCEPEKRITNFIDINKYLQNEFQSVHFEPSLLLRKKYKEEMAKNKYNDYLEELNKELLKPNNVVVFTDGGRKKQIGVSSYIIVDGKKVYSKSYLSGLNQSAFNEPIAMLKAMKEVITNPELKDRKIHFVCDSDSLFDLKESFTDSDVKIQGHILGFRDYKEVKDLMKTYENKIYFHFVKSHRERNNFMTYGNDMVDTLNKERLLIAAETEDSKDLSEKYKREKSFNEYTANLELNFYAGLTRKGNIKPKDSFEPVREIKEGNKRLKKRISGNIVKR